MDTDIAKAASSDGGTYKWFPDPQPCNNCRGYVTVVERNWLIYCNECGERVYAQPKRDSFMLCAADGTILYAVDSTIE